VLFPCLDVARVERGHEVVEAFYAAAIAPAGSAMA